MGRFKELAMYMDDLIENGLVDYPSMEDITEYRRQHAENTKKNTKKNSDQKLNAATSKNKPAVNSAQVVVLADKKNN